MNRKCKEAFTLIELLIVVAIIAILALIAVPNFLEAQTRAKISRAKADMRTLDTGLESYRVDHNSVPPVDSWQGWPGEPQKKMDDPGPFWILLTTPIAYLTTPIFDPFIKWTITGVPSSTATLDKRIQVGVGTLGYLDPDWQMAHDYWAAMSFGPDFSDDTVNTGDYPYTDVACPYDPTNGTVSLGDIYRFSGRAPTNFLSDYNRSLDPNGLGPWW